MPPLMGDMVKAYMFIHMIDSRGEQSFLSLFCSSRFLVVVMLRDIGLHPPSVSGIVFNGPYITGYGVCTRRGWIPILMSRCLCEGAESLQALSR